MNLHPIIPERLAHERRRELLQLANSSRKSKALGS
jgi:hypothetical protein